MKTLAFAAIAALTLAVPAHAEDCEKAGSMSAVRACVYERFEQDLDAAYRPLHRNLSAKNPEAAALLQKSQDSWTKFAADSCDFTARMNANDMIESDARLNCHGEFAYARIKVLKAWAAKYK